MQSFSVRDPDGKQREQIRAALKKPRDMDSKHCTVAGYIRLCADHADEILDFLESCGKLRNYPPETASG